MYDFIKGTLVEISPTHAVVETNGVGWKISIPYSSYARMDLSSQVLLFTSFLVRDTGHFLFGFLTKHERHLFEQLLDINGVGPKTALALVGHLEYDHLVSSIQSSDTKTLVRVPGIGKKTAERIVLEIKDKLRPVNPNPRWSLSQDAIRALVHLGYSDLVAQKAVAKALDEAPEDLPTLITLALKQC